MDLPQPIEYFLVARFGSTWQHVYRLDTSVPITIDSSSLSLTELLDEEEEGYGLPKQLFDEGTNVTLNGLFTNVDVDDTHFVTIDWGDRTIVELDADPSTPVRDPFPAGVRGFAATHSYGVDESGGFSVDTSAASTITSEL